MKAHIGPTFAAARAKPLIGFLFEQQAFALLLEGPLISPEMRRSMARQLQGHPQAYAIWNWSDRNAHRKIPLSYMRTYGEHIEQERSRQW